MYLVETVMPKYKFSKTIPYVMDLTEKFSYDRYLVDRCLPRRSRPMFTLLLVTPLYAGTCDRPYA